MVKPLILTGPVRVTVKKTSNANGRSILIVKCNRQQRTINYSHRSTVPYYDAIHDAFGRAQIIVSVIEDRPGFRRFEVQPA